MGDSGKNPNESWRLSSLGSATCAKCKYRFFGCPFTIQLKRFENAALLLRIHMASIDDKYGIYGTMEHEKRSKMQTELPKHMRLNNRWKFIGLNVGRHRTNNPSEIFERYLK